MTVVVETAEAMGASRLLDITSAHVDSCLYHGQAGLDFARRLAEGGARVRVPTTLNVSSLDLLHPELNRLGANQGPAKAQMEAYVEMGGRPTWTCAPYQLESRPALGEQIAWAESNAVVFANSVLGARTNRYGDFIDISCAVTGRAPAIGLHLDQGRKPNLVIEFVADLRFDQDWLYWVIGCLVGMQSDLGIPALVGLPSRLSEDRLKSLGAGSATTGSVALFHAEGSTPEAPSSAELVGLSRVVIGKEEVMAMRAKLNTTEEPPQGVSLGAPHYSVEELSHLNSLLDGRQVQLPVFVNTSRGALAASPTVAAGLQECGVQLITDTCTYLVPLMDPGIKVAMTDSGKWAYYAPGNLGIEVRFASVQECVEAAVNG